MRLTQREFDDILDLAEYASGYSAECIVRKKDDRKIPTYFRQVILYMLIVELELSPRQIAYFWPVPITTTVIKRNVIELEDRLRDDNRLRLLTVCLLKQMLSLAAGYRWKTARVTLPRVEAEV